MSLRVARMLLLACSLLFVFSVSAFYAEGLPRAETQSLVGERSELSVAKTLQFSVFQPLRTLRVESASQLDDDEPWPDVFTLLVDWSLPWQSLLLAGLLPCLLLARSLAGHWHQPSRRLHEHDRHPRHHQYRYLQSLSVN